MKTDLDIHSGLQDVGLDTNMHSPEHIGSGFTSSVYAFGGQVVKISLRSFGSDRAAFAQADALSAEHRWISDYMEHVAQARFVVTSAFGGGPRVVVIQDRVEGISIGEAFRQGQCIEELSVYFANAQRMYHKTRRVPDLACFERRFDPLRDDNTIIPPATKEGIFTPTLVDTTLGNLQRSTAVGWLINRRIFAGLARAQESLALAMPH